MRVRLDPEGFFRRIPLAPHQLDARITPTKDVIVLCHLGVPHLSPGEWSLEVGGLVERPLRLTLDDLERFARHDVESVHQCAGSPLEPTVPTRRVCNVVWSGVRLADVLEAAGVKPDARFVWSTGADHGTFAGVACGAYAKDLPLARVAHDVLLADRVNGAPLPPEHGFPLRLVVPGFYGTNSVKWLTRIELAAHRATGPFTTRWYNDADGAPVWALAPEAVITTPGPDTVVSAGALLAVEGWAWADGGVRTVQVRVDGQEAVEANLDPMRGRAWQRFRAHCEAPASAAFAIKAFAIANDGRSQPDTGARNAAHQVILRIR
ncbi:MAG: sulfite oxidase-like oxidoreductase [Hyphomicrobiales bacterium]|nr:MAG: sulfite oxidase-like oxidoreductase [Hyphomicrobiales bacterium]